jgi:hypothetical protein
MKPCINQHCSFHEIGTPTGCKQNIESCQNYTTKKEGSGMKRYKLILDLVKNALSSSTIGMFEDPEGEWVKFEDVKKEIERARIILRCQTEELYRGGPPCICEEMQHEYIYEYSPDGHGSPQIKERRPPIWICPAHGYKKR